jgi:hypothetical protein
MTSRMGLNCLTRQRKKAKYHLNICFLASSLVNIAHLTRFSPRFHSSNAWWPTPQSMPFSDRREVGERRIRSVRDHRRIPGGLSQNAGGVLFHLQRGESPGKVNPDGSGTRI